MVEKCSNHYSIYHPFPIQYSNSPEAMKQRLCLWVRIHKRFHTMVWSGTMVVNDGYICQLTWVHLSANVYQKCYNKSNERRYHSNKHDKMINCDGWIVGSRPQLLKSITIANSRSHNLALTS